jgi:hypothetical protein
MLDADIERLRVELKVVVNWATKTIAHLDPRAPEKVPKLSELRQALDVVAGIASKARWVRSGYSGCGAAVDDTGDRWASAGDGTVNGD